MLFVQNQNKLCNISYKPLAWGVILQLVKHAKINLTPFCRVRACQAKSVFLTKVEKRQTKSVFLFKNLKMSVFVSSNA